MSIARPAIPSLDVISARLNGMRLDMPPPRLRSIRHELVVDSDAPDRRRELLHDKLRKFGAAFNTVAPGTELSGVLRQETQTR